MLSRSFAQSHNRLLLTNSHLYSHRSSHLTIKYFINYNTYISYTLLYIPYIEKREYSAEWGHVKRCGRLRYPADPRLIFCWLSVRFTGRESLRFC